jgi:5-methylcytosine-specific restriction endonuclease McrA
VRQFVTAADVDALRTGAPPADEYAAYLRSPEWEAKRRGRMALAQYRCEVCNTGRDLHVHHRTYARRGRELLEDLIVLCSECHALFHGARRLDEVA